MTTANSARSMRRRRSSTEGKKLPRRSLGMASSTSPALVDNSRGRCPLRWFVRDSERSWGSAPISSVASDSISACSTSSTLRRMTSMLPPARSASSSSDRSDSLRAIGGISFVNPARNTSQISPVAHQVVDALRRPTPRHGTHTRHGQGRSRDCTTASPEPETKRSVASLRRSQALACPTILGRWSYPRERPEGRR